MVVPDHAEAKPRLREAGFEVEDTRQLWGADRAFAIAPGGHRVELMAAPPAHRPVGGDANQRESLLADLHLGDHPLDHVGRAARLLVGNEAEEGVAPGLEVGGHDL